MNIFQWEEIRNTVENQVNNNLNNLVSVIIPTYNCASYILETIDSVLKQSFQPFEIIIIDDGSTDNTREILNPYIESGRLRYYYQENKGPAAARNKGIREAKGEYVAFLDADDIWHPSKIELQMKYLSNNLSVFALSTIMVPYEAKNHTSPDLCEYEIKSYSFKDMLIRARMCTPTMVIRKDILLKVGGFREDLKLCEDHELWLRLSQFGNLYKIMIPLVYYRARADGLSAGNRDRTVKEHLKFINELFEERYRQYRKQYLRKTISVCCFYVSIEYTEMEKFYKAIKYLILSIIYCPFGFPEKSNYRVQRLRRFLVVCKIFLNKNFCVLHTKRRQKFKIAILSSGLGHVTRGVETSARNLAYGLYERGINITLYKGSNNHKFSGNSVLERVLPCFKRTSKLTEIIRKVSPASFWHIGLGSEYDIEQTSFSIFLLLETLFKQYDIIHTQDPIVANVLNTAHKFKLIKSKVIFANGTEEPFKFIKKFLYVQHLAPFHLQEAQEQGIAGKQFVIPNFVDIDKFKPRKNSDLRKKWGFKDNDFIILAVSAIKRHHKRIDYLIKEVSKIKANNFILIVAGSETNDTVLLKHLGKTLLKEKIKFLVDLPYEKMPEIYNIADLFVHCSLKEMLGNAIIEALSSGLPCICNIHPVLEWVVGKGGECVDMSKEDVLAKTVEKYFNKDLRDKISKETRVQAINNFSKGVVLDKMIDMFRSVLNGR